MQMLEKQSKCDRKEKALEPVKASQANELKYGANVVKFQPPVSKGG